MNVSARIESSRDDTDVLLTNNTTVTTAQSRVGGTRLAGTIFLIVNATLGAGLLNFPQAFDNAGGIASAIIMQMGFLIFITSALIILAHCSDVTKTSSMQDTLAGLCGTKALFICGICVAIYSFGCCLTFVIIIGDQFDRVMATFYGMDYCHTWYLSRPFVTSVTCAIFILPLCFFKKLELLSYASSIGCLTIFYVVWLVVNEYAKNNDNAAPKSTQTWPVDATQALKIVPIICFAYQSHMTAIPTYACMKHRDIKKFSICCFLSMITCFSVYTIVGIYGYKTFGNDNVPDDILQGYEDESLTLTVAIIAIAMKNFTTYPIVLFCGRNAILGLIYGDDNVNDNDFARIFVTLFWFFFSVIIAISVPNIGPVINILGTLSAAFIFVFPGICLVRCIVVKDPTLIMNKNRFYVFSGVMITAVGGFVCGFVFVESIRDIARDNADTPLVTGFKSNLGQSLCN